MGRTGKWGRKVFSIQLSHLSLKDDPFCFLPVHSKCVNNSKNTWGKGGLHLLDKQQEEGRGIYEVQSSSADLNSLFQNEWETIISYINSLTIKYYN